MVYFPSNPSDRQQVEEDSLQVEEDSLQVEEDSLVVDAHSTDEGLTTDEDQLNHHQSFPSNCFNSHSSTQVSTNQIHSSDHQTSDQNRRTSDQSPVDVHSEEGYASEEKSTGNTPSSTTSGHTFSTFNRRCGRLSMLNNNIERWMEAADRSLIKVQANQALIGRESGRESLTGRESGRESLTGTDCQGSPIGRDTQVPCSSSSGSGSPSSGFNCDTLINTVTTTTLIKKSQLITDSTLIHTRPIVKSSKRVTIKDEKDADAILNDDDDDDEKVNMNEDDDDDDVTTEDGLDDDDDRGEGNNTFVAGNKVTYVRPTSMETNSKSANSKSANSKDTNLKSAKNSHTSSSLSSAPASGIMTKKSTSDKEKDERKRDERKKDERKKEEKTKIDKRKKFNVGSRSEEESPMEEMPNSYNFKSGAPATSVLVINHDRKEGGKKESSKKEGGKSERKGSINHDRKGGSKSDDSDNSCDNGPVLGRSSFVRSVLQITPKKSNLIPSTTSSVSNPCVSSPCVSLPVDYSGRNNLAGSSQVTRSGPESVSGNSVSTIAIGAGKGPLGIHVVPYNDPEEDEAENGLLIEVIEPGGRIHMDGQIRPNDRIIEINGHSLLHVDFLSAQNIFKSVLSDEQEIILKVIKHSGDDPSNLNPQQVRQSPSEANVSREGNVSREANVSSADPKSQFQCIGYQERLIGGKNEEGHKQSPWTSDSDKGMNSRKKPNPPSVYPKPSSTPIKSVISSSASVNSQPINSSNSSLMNQESSLVNQESSLINQESSLINQESSSLINQESSSLENGVEEESSLIKRDQLVEVSTPEHGMMKTATVTSTKKMLRGSFRAKKGHGGMGNRREFHGTATALVSANTRKIGKQYSITLIKGHSGKKIPGVPWRGNYSR